MRPFGNRLARALPVSLALLLLPVSASADTNSIAITSATLVTRAAVTVTMTVTCPAGAQIQFGSVQIEQANGKELASGSTQLFGGTCTGAEQVLQTNIWANTGGPPFKKGWAAASANLGFFNPSDFTSGSVSTGIVQIKLT